MADFLILTALRKEFDPLRDRFKAKRLPKHHADDGYEHYEAAVDTQNGISYSVRLLCAGRKGAKYTTAAVGCGIRRWKPRYVIMTGIAATVPGDARRIGHILVADTIIDLTESKVLPKAEKPRPDPFRCDNGLLQSIDALPPWSIPVETGIIVAQNQLVKSAKLREKLVEIAEKTTGRTDIIGIEMEGGGLGAAIDTQPGDAKPGFILIKGAVDFANYHKNDAAQKKAANDAAAFVYDFLVFGPIGKSGNASKLSRSSVRATKTTRSKGTLPSLEELEKQVRIHNRASFSEIGFSVGPNFVPVQKVYVERTKAQSIIDTKLSQISEPDLNQIIVVTGLAGSGKTSLLDDLSRRLEPKNTIPFLVRSEDLIDTDEPGYFQLRFNDCVYGDEEPPSWQVLRNMCERFSEEHRSFLVMIDTVDFLVTQSNFSWRSFYSLLVELASLPYIGICMTCRPYEFEHIKTGQFFQVPLGNLTDEEIFIALNNYVDCFYEENAFSEAQKKRLRERAESDHKFRRIVADPLKLRMLFEAYRGREIHEEEISTAKLYDRYWQVKIWSESRRPVPAQEPLSRLAASKDKTCRNIAFELLVDKKLEFDEPQSVGDASDSTSRRAWSELRSDAVIHQPIATIRKYQFFHETFLEYASARHIATSSRSAIAADWLVHHLAQNADFFVAPIISHLAVLDPGLASKIAQGLYTAKTETIDPLFTKRLAIEIFTNVEEPERSAVGDYLLTASLRDENQLLVESLVQRAGHLPSSSVPFALTLLAKVWRAKRSDRIHLLALQALADLSRADAKSVWNWMQNEGIDVLEFTDANRESFGSKVAIALEIFANCYGYNSELINKKMLAWYETGGEATRTAIVSLLITKVSSSPSDPIWEIVLRKFRDEPRREWGIQIARAAAQALTKLPKSTVAKLVPIFMKMLQEKEPLSRRAAVLLGTLAVTPGQRKLFDELWKKFRSNRDQTGNLYIIFRQMAEDGYQPLIKKMKGLPIDGNAQRLELLTDCPLVPPLPLKLIRHLIDDSSLRMKMALARAFVKSSSLYCDAHSLLRELIENRWSARERAYAIGAMEKLNKPESQDVDLLMKLYPTLDSKAKLSSARTIAAWSRTVKNDPNFVGTASGAIRKLIDDDSTAVQEAAVDALTAQNELAPVFSQAILKASSSGSTGIRLKSIRLMLPSGNEKCLLQMAKSDPDENIRREAVFEIVKSFTPTQLTSSLSSAEDGIMSEKSTGVLRAWCFATSSAARVDPKISSQVICAVIRQAGLLQLSKEAQKDVGKNVTHTIHRLVQAHTEKLDEILSDIIRVAKEVLNLFPRPAYVVIGIIEGLTRGLAITDARLQAILADTTIPEVCKEPIYNKQKGMRITTQARLTELEAIIKGSKNSYAGNIVAPT